MVPAEGKGLLLQPRDGRWVAPPRAAELRGPTLRGRVRQPPSGLRDLGLGEAEVVVERVVERQVHLDGQPGTRAPRARARNRLDGSYA
jgi:hypothetical protein